VFLFISEDGIEKEVAKFALVKANANAGKNSPVDYFSDAARRIPAICTMRQWDGVFVWPKNSSRQI
jgi:hypothetical protein